MLAVYFNQHAQYVACGRLGRTTPRFTRATVYPEVVAVLHMVPQSLPPHALRSPQLNIDLEVATTLQDGFPVLREARSLPGPLLRVL